MHSQYGEREFFTLSTVSLALKKKMSEKKEGNEKERKKKIQGVNFWLFPSNTNSVIILFSFVCLVREENENENARK